MSLTPEQWRKLDEAEKRFAAAHQTYIHQPMGNMQARTEALARLQMAATPFFRTLIDAARPKCGRCAGRGSITTWCPDPQCGDSTWDHDCGDGTTPCPDCKGTGWAQ